MARHEEDKAHRKLVDDWIRGPRESSGDALILIAHLGNIDGQDVELQNTPAYLQAALAQGWHVCCDVVSRHGGFALPTQRGLAPMPYSMLSHARVWCRAADPETFDALAQVGAHIVLRDTNSWSPTNHGYLWTHPDAPLTPRSIAAYPELAAPDWLKSREIAGICSNEIARYL